MRSPGKKSGRELKVLVAQDGCAGSGRGRVKGGSERHWRRGQQDVGVEGLQSQGEGEVQDGTHLGACFLP